MVQEKWNIVQEPVSTLEPGPGLKSQEVAWIGEE